MALSFFDDARRTARRYAEGTGFRVPVRTREDVQAVQRLATIKMGG